MGEILEATEIEPGRWAAGPAPGLYPDLTNDEYQDSDGVSKSHLDDVAPPKTPLHYYDKRLAPDREPRKKTPALILGDAIHKAVLEPDLFDRNIGQVPDDAPPRPSSRTFKAKNPSMQSQDNISWWVDFDEQNAGKIVLSALDFATALRARDAVHTHPVAKTLFRGGNSEQSYYANDPETGALIKCRCDYEQLELEASVTDLKTCENASPEGIRSSFFNYRYDLQDPWYRHVMKWAFDGQLIVRRFAFVFVEKTRPCAIGIHWLNPEDIAAGMAFARRDFELILRCKETGLWPDFGCTPSQLPRLGRKR